MDANEFVTIVCLAILSLCFAYLVGIDTTQ